MTFEEYLAGKKIHSANFQSAETHRWKEYQMLFEQMHPESFTTQKKFVINQLRRLYPLKEVAPAVVSEPARKPISKPAIPSKAKETPVKEEAVTPIADPAVPSENGTQLPKKPGKPVMRPIVKKPASETTETDSSPAPLPEADKATPPAETARKPARPVIKPVIKKPVAEPPPPDAASSEEKVTDEAQAEPTAEETAPPPAQKKARPVIRPVIRKPNTEKE